MITTSQYLEMLRRTEKNTVREPPKAAEKEVGHGGLQGQILNDCRKRWPPWKVIQARPDKCSTIALGAHDLTVFADGGRIFLVETKAKGKKPTPAQLQWAKELEMLGHKVEFVYSFEQWDQLTQS